MRWHCVADSGIDYMLWNYTYRNACKLDITTNAFRKR